VEEITIKQFRGAIAGKSKYRNRKSRCGHGHVHDSYREALRCDELYHSAGEEEISQLKQQPRFVLQRGFRYEGKKIRSLCYVADFSYLEDGIVIIEDVKGMKTAVYKLKKKLLLHKFRNRAKWEFRET